MPYTQLPVPELGLADKLGTGRCVLGTSNCVLAFNPACDPKLPNAMPSGSLPAWTHSTSLRHP